MSDQNNLNKLLLQRGMADLRADFAEYACIHPLDEALAMLLSRLCELLSVESAFCALVAPSNEKTGGPLRYCGPENPLVLRDQEARTFLDHCLTQLGCSRLRLEHQELVGVSFLSDDKPLGAVGLARALSWTPIETALLEDLGRTVGRLIELKHRQEINSYIMMAMDTVQEVVVITDLDGTIEYVNPAFERTTGYSKEEALGQNPRLYNSGQHDKAFYEALWATLLSGETWHGRLVNRRKDGSLFDEEGSITPIRGKHGKTMKYFCVKRDITEKLLLERQLWQAQKMETVGILAGGIAHDYNNALGVIVGFLELATQNLDDKEAVAEALAEVRNAADHSAAITSQLLAFARKQLAKPVILSVCETVQSMVTMLQRLLGEQVSLRVTECDKESKVSLDPNQLQQILTNLCLNARDATSGRGTIEIAVGQKLFGPKELSEFPYLKEGTYAFLSVQDNGCGMDKETSNRIFEPFFSTKLNKGNGLGMSMVYGIVKQNNGFIILDSAPGKGTLVSIYFPLVSGQVHVSEVQPSAVTTKSLDYHILLVEDDPGMLRMTSKMLARLGCTAALAASAEEALLRCQEATDPFHLLLTDVILPTANGAELNRSIREFFPDIATLFVSGYTADIVLGEVNDLGVRFLKKPFTLDELRGEVAQAVEDAQAFRATLAKPPHLT